jgi:hypothetical protein
MNKELKTSNKDYYKKKAKEHRDNNPLCSYVEINGVYYIFRKDQVKKIKPYQFKDLDKDYKILCDRLPYIPAKKGTFKKDVVTEL